jgi:SusD family/Starch-binding associating with outer membrane
MNNMKDLLRIIAVVVILFQLPACKKFTTAEIKTEIDLNTFGKNPAEASLLLGQAYNELRNNNITGSRYYVSFTTDYNVPATGTTFANSAIARLNYDASDGEAFSIWTDHYRAISRPNLVIERAQKFGKVSGISKADSANWSKIEGEARFLRAFLYFNLVRLYRNIPIISTFFTELSQIESVANLPAAQMREQESKVYEFIIDDLMMASNMLPNTSERGRASKFTALAYLGKVYLNRATIAKHRDMTGNGAADYTNAIAALQQVIASGQYALKTYYPDNFIRDKQYSGNREFVFTVEFEALDGGQGRFGENSGFINNAGAINDLIGTQAGANGASSANDFGWSAFDFSSPGDLVRRFWTFEDGDFRSFETNGVAGLQNTVADCPNGAGCEIYIRSREPYQFTRPYWFEAVNNVNSFRYRPAAADVVTGTGVNNRWFSTIWGDGNANSTPGVQLVKFRRNPLTQPNYTGAIYDADIPVMRYAEVLLMYAEAGNELGGPSIVPPGGSLTPVAAINLLRDRARNFVFYPTLTVNSKIIENSTYNRTYADIFRRVPTTNVVFSQTPAANNPVLTTTQAADTMTKYFNQICAFRGIREVPAAPIIRNFKEFPATAGYVPDFSSGLSQSQFRNDLLDERWRELAGEQNCRWYDLTRYGILINRITSIKTQINPLTNRSLATTQFGSSVLPNPNPKFQYLPIPQNERDLNKKLEQNEGF